MLQLCYKCSHGFSGALYSGCACPSRIVRLRASLQGGKSSTLQCSPLCCTALIVHKVCMLKLVSYTKIRFVCLSVTGGQRKWPWPRIVGCYIQAWRSLDTSRIVWLRALGLLLPTVAISTFMNVRGMCKIGSWSSRCQCTVSDRNVSMRKTLLWHPWRWMATMFLISAWRVTSPIVAVAKFSVVIDGRTG